MSTAGPRWPRGGSSRSETFAAGYFPAIAGSAPFDVAFVCTGNRFRSPLAAALLESSGLPVRPHSLGLLDLGPVPALPEAVELAAEIGLDLSRHRARQLDEVELADSDLVLGFEQIHVSTAVVDGQAAIGRTFTLPEFVALLQSLPEASLGRRGEAVEVARARVEQAHARRAGSAQNRSAPEIEDPLGRSLTVQRRTAEEIRLLVAELGTRLFG